MEVKLQNDFMGIVVSAKGAEMTSLHSKDTGVEYLWQADPAIWARHSPILFPIVGRLKENKYKLNGQEYSLPQHGFARDLNFELLENGKSSAVFQLLSNSDTRKSYPFDFSLKVAYTLIDNELTVMFEVINEDTLNMPFSIGAHPGFRCPILNGEHYEDYYLEFSKSEDLNTHLLQDGLFTKEMLSLGTNMSKLSLSKELFDRDALVFKNLKSDSITLKSYSNSHSIRLEFPSFPYLGIWSKPGTSQFICIEPWFGLADSEYSTGEITDKEGIINLAPEETFNCAYKIALN